MIKINIIFNYLLFKWIYFIEKNTKKFINIKVLVEIKEKKTNKNKFTNNPFNNYNNNITYNIYFQKKYFYK